MDKINYKLINILSLVAIIYLLYLTKGLFIDIFNIMLSILFPFFISFIIAYILYPIISKLRNTFLNKYLSIIIVIILLISIITIIIGLILPIIYKELLLFISNINVLISDISSMYNIDLNKIYLWIDDEITKIVSIISNIIKVSIVKLLSKSISVVTTSLLIFISSIYLLIDMDKIRYNISNYIYNKNIKIYNYLKLIDIEISKYIKGIGINIIVQTIEYTFAFLIIGHPNYLVLGILSGISSIIPFFGGLVVSIIALLISSVISMKLFILTSIICIICPQIDGYIISPKIYGKTNKLHPLVIIFAIFTGSILGNIWLILLSVPIVIIIISTYNYIKKYKTT